MEYEYKIEIITKHDGNTYETIHETELIDELGQQGWKLISTSTMGFMVYGYFVRQKGGCSCNCKPTVSQ